MTSHVSHDGKNLSCVVHGWNLQNLLRTLKSSWNSRFDLCLVFSGKLSSPISHNGENWSCVLQELQLERVHRKTGGMSYLRHFLRSYVLTSLTTEKTCLVSYTAEPCRMYKGYKCQRKNRRNELSLVFFDKLSPHVTHVAQDKFAECREHIKFIGKEEVWVVSGTLWRVKCSPHLWRGKLASGRSVRKLPECTSESKEELSSHVTHNAEFWLGIVRDSNLQYVQKT